MTATPSGAMDAASLSVECTVTQEPGYEYLHRECRQTEDVPLPHSMGLLLARRCGCACHAQVVRKS
ncbi:hypothetical protein [Streptomyces sp. NPDC002845]